MSLDSPKSETDIGFELLKAFGIMGGLLTTVVLLICLNPGIGAGLVALIFPVTPISNSIASAMHKVEKDLAEAQTREGAYTPSSTITAALGYGEGLTAFKDLEANALLVPKDIGGRSKFPITELGQCSPLGYASLIGKKTKSRIKCGQFFTTANVEL